MSVSRRGGRLCTNILYVYIDSGDGMTDPCRDISHCTNLTLFFFSFASASSFLLVAILV